MCVCVPEDLDAGVILYVYFICFRHSSVSVCINLPCVCVCVCMCVCECVCERERKRKGVWRANWTRATRCVTRACVFCINLIIAYHVTTPTHVTDLTSISLFFASPASVS